MKSKIEKLVIYYDEILGKDRDVRILDMANKIDEIIDHLNSQDQGEEKTVCEGCGKAIISRFMQSYSRDDGLHYYCLSCNPETEDTPEEWLVVLAKDIAKENGWKEWGYRYDDKFLYVWEKCKLYSVKVPLDKLRQ